MPRPDFRNVPGQDIKVSFADVFKSSKMLKAERAIVARKREQLKAENKRLAELQAAMAQVTKGPPKANSTPAPPPPIRPPEASQQKNEPGASSEIKNWTDKEDEQLSKLKQDNVSWKTIAETMKWPVSDLKERWRIIKPPEPPKEAKPDKEESKADNKKEKNKQKVAFTEPSKDKPSKEGSKKVIYYTDESLSLEEVILLNKLAEKYDKEMWLRISSKFFDKTGKRLDPEEAKRHVRPS
ncbi:uncharacterized protein GIQ15_05530 [Arthroderma uncinatum]|uniref:uncharacterized protein n=1 Tax=Arthroderma uncinatum TaxID=74035 RepID=UPI00144A524E|nr:uncharacterized protein GIQ15_05530 [Arthroderma uncinatum]KAF3480183.1 hypothetical protein GIQ15_05530 [Arthroderma uncinatum]